MDLSAAATTAGMETVDPTGFSRLRGLLLVRIAAEVSDAGAITRDTWKLAPATVSADRWAQDVDAELDRLTAAGLAARTGNAYAATLDGVRQACRFLGLRAEKGLAGGWPAARDGALLLVALGLTNAPAKRQRAVEKIDGLRMALVVHAFGLKLKGAPSPSRIRSALALVALERAFGNSVKGALGAKTDLSAKASRLLAGQLSKSPRDYGTDARLVAALAAEAAGVSKADLASLRQGAIRRFIAGGAVEGAAPKAERRRGKAVAPVVSAPEPNWREDAVPTTPLPPQSARVAARIEPVRPDPKAFAAAVNAAANARAEGWSGNRKAFVSAVWALVREQHPQWQISEIEFKSMLTEAHRVGLVVLANADLKDKRHMAEIQASAIPYKNTVWHYIRVEG